MEGLTAGATPSRLVLFDVDGTLVDTAGAGRIALDAAFAAVWGLPGLTERHRDVRFAGMTDRYIFDALAAAAGLDGGEVEVRRPRLVASYLEALAAEMARPEPARRMMPGLPGLLDALDARTDVVLGLVTGNLRDGARLKLEPFGLNRYFAGGGFGSDHADRRVVARLGRDEMTRRSGRRFEPRNVWIVGDTDRDVDCARANGFRSLAVSTGWCTPDRLRASGPDRLLDDLEDVEAVIAALELG